jgi:hypothetical protein
MIDQQCGRRIVDTIVINTMHAFFEEGVHGTTLNNNKAAESLENKRSRLWDNLCHQVLP